MTQRIGFFLLFAALALPAWSKGDEALRVEHYLTYSFQGSRSEARHGHLRINGVAIPYGFSRVTVAGSTYRTLYRRYHWGEDGYHAVYPPFMPPAGTESLTDETLRKGYVQAVGRPVNLPEDWFYVEWGDGSAFVAPRALDDLIREQGIALFCPEESPELTGCVPGHGSTGQAGSTVQNAREIPPSFLDGLAREVADFPDSVPTKEVIE